MLSSELFSGPATEFCQGLGQLTIVRQAAAKASGTHNLLLIGGDFFQFQTGDAVQLQHGSGNHDIELAVNAFAGLSCQVPDGLDAKLIELGRGARTNAPDLADRHDTH